jgi:hypothetical protein
MNLTSDHLADLLIGIARAQNAVIDAIDRANPGFRSQHAAPMITLAANMRAGDPRMIDLSSRILMRLQGRVALDAAQVKADLERPLRRLRRHPRRHRRWTDWISARRAKAMPARGRFEPPDFPRSRRFVSVLRLAGLDPDGAR